MMKKRRGSVSSLAVFFSLKSPGVGIGILKQDHGLPELRIGGERGFDLLGPADVPGYDFSA